MSGQCIRSGCNSPTYREHRCLEHFLQRRERQRRTAMQPSCVGCGNKTRHEDQLCASCRRERDDDNVLRRSIEGLQTVEDVRYFLLQHMEKFK